jgi:hypothetical protein
LTSTLYTSNHISLECFAPITIPVDQKVRPDIGSIFAIALFLFLIESDRHIGALQCLSFFLSIEWRHGIGRDMLEIGRLGDLLIMIAAGLAANAVYLGSDVR